MTVISVENVSKSYRLGQIGGGSLKADVSRWLAMLRGKPDPNLKIGEEHLARKMGDQFWALDDVSFEVKEGEVLGIIGRNGAGKSTLLKILSQVTTPTSGQIKIKGRIASLLEVGTGFNPEMTGRENVFLNGAILGMTKVEIRQKFDEIVAFSGVEEFIDTPVKRYSSGMYVRLAFAVAAHLEPEILIIDEVLAVGDAQFQKKCIGKIQEVGRGGRTVLFVSHNMGVMANLCNKVYWLKDGQLHKSGDAKNIVQEYLAVSTVISSDVLDLDKLPREGANGERIRMLALDWLGSYPLQHGRPAKIRIVCKANFACDGVSVGIGFSNLEGSRLLTYDSDLTDGKRFDLKSGQTISFNLEIPELPVAPGIYLIDVGIRSGDVHGMDYVSGAAQIEVIPGRTTPGFIIRQGAGIRLPSHCTMDIN